MIILVSANNTDTNISVTEYLTMEAAKAALKEIVDDAIAEQEIDTESYDDGSCDFFRFNGDSAGGMSKTSFSFIYPNGDMIYGEIKEIKQPDVWYEEIWTDEDLKDALEYRLIPATEENVKKLKKEVTHLFDDKSDRNEMIDNKVCELFE